MRRAFAIRLSGQDMVRPSSVVLIVLANTRVLWGFLLAPLTLVTFSADSTVNGLLSETVLVTAMEGGTLA